MTKHVFSILIIVCVSFSSTNSATSAHANESTSDNHMICIFSVILCMNDQLQKEESQKHTNKKFIYSIIDKANFTKLIYWIDNLSSFHTRHTKSEYIENAAYWLKNELESVCKGRVYFHNFTQTDQGTSYNLKNIICNQQGSTADNDNHLILISAHYDSRMQDINQTNARAPGADDNASGVAGVLELARVLSKVDLKSNIQFVLFSGEEQGQWGSTAYVKNLQTNNNNTKLDLVLNLDMIGYPPLGLSKVVIEYDLGNKYTTNDIYSKKVGQFIGQIASEYTTLEASFRTLGKTDLIPFEAAGKTVIGFHDGGSELNPNYHNLSDTPSTLDIKYLTSVTKLALATILDLDEFSYK